MWNGWPLSRLAGSFCCLQVTSVVDGFCRCHDIPNLYICSASVFVTSGGCNPTKTVMAIAARTADHVIKMASKKEYAYA